jgi:hypothetical protein
MAPSVFVDVGFVRWALIQALSFQTLVSKSENMLDAFAGTLDVDILVENDLDFRICLSFSFGILSEQAKRFGLVESGF